MLVWLLDFSIRGCLKIITTIDLIKGLEEKLKKEFPRAGYCIFNMPKDINMPAFLFTNIKRNKTDGNYYLNKIKLELQIVYYGITNENGFEVIEDKMKTIESIDRVLGDMNLKVKDRNINFNYGYVEADRRFTINLTFEFMEDKEFETENYEKMETIKISSGKGEV